jgi:hypothetical protein
MCLMLETEPCESCPKRKGYLKILVTYRNGITHVEVMAPECSNCHVKLTAKAERPFKTFLPIRCAGDTRFQVS